MPDTTGPTVDMSELRLGLFVHLDLGWMDHPFPLGSFKISSQQQIDTIRTLGLKRLRYSPDKSDPPPTDVVPAPVSAAPAVPQPPSPEAQERARHKALLQAQRLSLQQCERQFAEAAKAYRQVVDDLENQPDAARERGLAVVHGVVAHMAGAGDSAIRLLSEGLGDRTSLYSVNVMVLSLLLGKAIGLSTTELQDLGVAALLHDVGKTALPERVRFREDGFTPAQFKLYQEHVGHSLNLGKQLGLNPRVLLAMAQHHEMADGTGFPLGVRADKIAPASCILALINRYDNLCNPGSPGNALTAHEARALIFAQMKERFDGKTLSGFMRMVGGWNSTRGWASNAASNRCNCPGPPWTTCRPARAFVTTLSARPKPPPPAGPVHDICPLGAFAGRDAGGGLGGGQPQLADCGRQHAGRPPVGHAHQRPAGPTGYRADRFP